MRCSGRKLRRADRLSFKTTGRTELDLSCRRRPRFCFGMRGTLETLKYRQLLLSRQAVASAATELYPVRLELADGYTRRPTYEDEMVHCKLPPERVAAGP